MKLKLRIVFFCNLFSLILTAQLPNWQWARNGMGSDWEYGTSVCTDASGNVLITGSYQSPSLTFGGTTLFKTGTSNNSTDIFIAKYDVAGSLLWARSDGGNGSEIGNGISTDASGNIFVTGSFNSPTLAFGSTTLTNSGFTDFFIVKYDAAGNVLWARSAGAFGTDQGNSICTDGSGNVFVTGYFDSQSITFGAITLSNISNNDMFIVKYDAAGNALWARVAGGSYHDVGNSISTDTGGNAFVTGSFQSLNITFGGTTLTNADNTASSPDIFIVKYDAAGNVLWAKSGTGTTFDFGNAICTDANGNAFVTGSFQSPLMAFGSATLTNSGGDDVFVAKYDAAGNVLWLRSVVGFTGNNEVGKGLSTDAGGNVFVAGFYTTPAMAFGTFTITNTTNTGIYSDIFVVKYDAAGNVLWANSEGGAVSDIASGISTGPGGSAFVVGSFQSPVIAFGSTTLNNSFVNPNNQPADVFLAKLEGNATGIIDERGSGFVRTFPNPFSTQMVLQSGVALNNATLILNNALGQKVKELKNISGSSFTIYRDELPAGLYFISITEQGNIVLSKKVVVTD